MSPRCLGRPRHVQLLLLLGDVGKHRTKALVLDDGSLIDLRPLVEGPIREVHAIVPDRKSAIRIIEDHDPLAGQGSCDLVRLQDKQHLSYCSVRFLETVRSSFQAKASSRSSSPASGRWRSRSSNGGLAKRAL